MKPNTRFSYFVLGNLIYTMLMGLATYYAWIHTVPVWFGIFLVIFLFLRWRDLFVAYSKAVVNDATYSINLYIKPTTANPITSEYIAEILNNKNVVQAIKNDLRKTDQIGYKEVWRLGLITSDQDWFDPRPDLVPQLERAKRFIKDNNYRYKWVEQFPLKRIATLHWPSYFNTQFNHILIANGNFKHRIYPWWTYHLHTSLNSGEYIHIRNIQVNANGSFEENRTPELADFLREDGFPLKDIYEDGDPLTTERGGVIVIDKDKILVTYPKYLSQRRLIDDEGNLVEIGIDEGFGLAGITEVKVRPAVLNSLVKYANSNGYTPILRYHSFPYTSDFMIPVLDTPISTSGWADLFIDPRGNGKLFITKEKTLFEWGEMMEKLRQLFYEALAGKDYHLLGLTKDKAYLNNYLARKMDILKDCYIIQDWQVP